MSPFRVRVVPFMGGKGSGMRKSEGLAHGRKRAEQKTSAHPIFDYLDPFLQILALKGRSSRTISSCRNDLLLFASSTQSGWKPGAGLLLSEKDAQAFLMTLSLAEYHPRSIARILSSLRGFYEYLVERSLVARNPFRGMKGPRVPRSQPKFLTIEEINQLLDAPDPSTWEGRRDRAILEVFYLDGLRLSELCSLNLGDLHGDVLLVRGKGNKERRVPVVGVARVRLLSFLEESGQKSPLDCLFPEVPGGKRLSVYQVGRIVRSSARKAGMVSNVTPHEIRHTCATHLLNNSMDLRHIQTLLGHSSLSSTQKYTHVGIRELKDRYDRSRSRPPGSSPDIPEIDQAAGMTGKAPETE